MNTYTQGTPVVLAATVTVSGVDEDPSGISLQIIDPGGTTITIPSASLNHTGPGQYSYTFDSTGAAPGTWVYEFISTGTGQSVAFGYFRVAALPSPKATLPRIGPCSQWVSGAQVQAQHYPANIAVDTSTAAEMALVATELLYNFSGQQFTGVCGPVTVRPMSRPVDADTRALVSRVPSGYTAVYGWGPRSGATSHYGTSNPPEVELGAYPVVEVIQVKIDGVVIPADEYYLQDYRTLVRIRPTAAATPTERYGWPTSQIIDLPDTEPGTFSVTYLYGTPPPQSGVTAALALARELVVARLGGNSAIPRRITTISRAGESVSVDDTRNILQRIPEVQVFLAAFNPSGLIRQPIVWSPDAGRPRRNPAGLV